MNTYYPSDDYPAVILENGSGSCRSGFAGQDAPLSAFPNVIGRNNAESSYIGYEAQDRREVLSLSRPIERGIVHSWEDMEKILNFAFFSDLQASPEQHPVLANDVPLNNKGNQEKMAELMFETFKAPAYFNAYEPALIMYGTGKCDGIILSCGEGVTYTSPIIGGCMSAPAKRLDFGGQDLTQHLQHLMYEKGFSFMTTSELDGLREIKEQMCYIKTSNETDSEDQSFKLPDGTHVNLGEERHSCPEILFSPDGNFNSGVGLHELVIDTLQECTADERKVLRGCIILSGGVTLTPGFISRLEDEITSASPKAESVFVSALPERKYHVWIGASILASLSTFNQMWITRQDYSECGPSVLHRKNMK